MDYTAPAFQIMPPRVFHQNAPHHLGRDREEMGAILPFHALIIRQAQVGFIYQSRGLQTVTGALPPHVAARQPVELCINDGGQLFERALVSAAPSTEQPAYITRSRV